MVLFACRKVSGGCWRWLGDPLRKFAAFGLLSVLALPFDVIGANAEQHVTAKAETFGDWQVVCRDQAETACSLETYGVSTGEQKVALQLSTVKTATGEALFILRTPLDLLLGKGIEMKVDSGNTMRLAYRSCHAGGCLVPFSISGEIERAFRRGAKLTFRVFDVSGNPIAISISLNGFTAASRKAGIGPAAS